MSTSSPANPFDGWTPPGALEWLEKQWDAEVAAVTDDDLVELFDAEILVSAFGPATLDMAKAWTESKHKRDKGGKFSTVAGAAVALAGGGPIQSHTVKGKPTIGDTHAAAHGITGAHGIVVHSTRVRKYAGHATVESFVASHKRGRAHALREIAADHKAGRIGFKAPTPKAAPKLQPLTGGKTLTGDHIVANASDNSLFSYAGVKDGDTLDQAAAKIAAKGHGPGVTAAAFAQAHAAGKITTAAGGKAVPVPLSASATAVIPKPVAAAPKVKARAAKPAKPSPAQKADAVKAAVPAKAWKDDPARWAKAPAAPLNTPKPEFGGMREWTEAGHLDALRDVRKAAGVPYTGTDDEAVSCYTGAGSSQINRELRAGKAAPSAYTDTVEDLDKLATAHTTKADVVLYRGVNTSGVKSYDGTPNLNNLPPPTSFDDAGYCSLSFNPGVSAGFSGATAEGNRAIFRVRVPKGSKMANIGRKETSDQGLTDEAECLLPRGSKFVYVGHQMIGGRKVIDIEHVPN